MGLVPETPKRGHLQTKGGSMRIYYYCDIFQQDYVLHASKNFVMDKEFFRGYLDRLGDRLQLIELDEGETWNHSQ
jgi:hypothetical protein